MNLLISIAAATLLLTAQHPAMPKGMSHEAHLKQVEKEALKNAAPVRWDSIRMQQSTTSG